MSSPHIVTVAADNCVPSDLDARLTTLLEGLVTQRGISYANIALASGDGKRHWAAASTFGAISEPTLSPGTPYFIASITKQFIITLVLQARESGEISLAAPINEYLPAQTVAGLHVLRGVERTSAITVRHLATHTSGLPDHFEKRRDGHSLYQRLVAGDDATWTFDDMIRTTRDHQRPHFEPQDLTTEKQKARYSDTGYQLLIRILEMTSGRSLAELLTERILDPLGLTHTWHPRHPPRDQAVPTPSPLRTRHRRVDVPMMIRSSNDLFSTSGDLITFHRALVGGEIGPASLNRLAERRNRLRNIPVLRYGCGTMVFTLNRLMTAGRRPITLVGHSGATGTWLFYCPELDVHLAGTIDQTNGQSMPFRIMARCLNLWRV